MGRKIFVVMLFILLTGCITSSYHKSNETYKNAQREFNTSFKNSPHIFRGVWAGIRTINGKKYHYLQFAGILKGEGRYLNILLPTEERVTPAYAPGPDGRMMETGKKVASPGFVIIKESSVRIFGSHSAYCVFQFYGSYTLDSFYALFNQKPGLVSNPVVIMKKHFNYKISGDIYPSAVVHLDFGNIFKYSTNAAVWEKGPDGKAVVSCTGIAIGGYDDPLIAVKWKKRNKFLYGLRQFGYVGTVIADIVSSPVQLIMFLLVGQAGPVVR